MDKLFQKIPFLRITLAFAVGIVMGNYVAIPLVISLLGITVILFLLVFLHQNYSFKTDSVFGFLVLILFILFGNLFFSNYNKKPHFYEDGIFLGTILESPQEKQNSYKSVIQLKGVKKEDSTFHTNEKLIAYFSKTESANVLKPGNTIVFQTTPQVVSNYGNPYEFDYKSYLQNKRIYRRVYLSENSWKPSELEIKSLITYSELLREKLLDIYRKQNLGTNETEILSALTLGYKRDLEPETKRVFSAAGAMHVLAVSGLHVGILYMVFLTIFGFLRKQKLGKYIFVISAIFLLWAYAFITGLSPSVMRASTMFTIVIIGSNINRPSNIYNSLAASALFLLIVNPNNIFEVGFQLSYAAVFGIVFLVPKFNKLWNPRAKFPKFIWSLLLVSIAAQLATFPFTSYYFNQFPTFFWLTNIIVIPAVTLLIPLGIVLLAVSKIPVLATSVAFLVKWLIKIVYLVLQKIEHLPYSTLDVSLSPIELSCLLASLFFIFLFIEHKNVWQLKLALSSLTVLFIAILLASIVQYKSRELIVYNNDSNTTLHLIAGRKNYVISQYDISKSDYLHSQILQVKRKKRLKKATYLTQNSSFEDDFLLLRNGLCAFEGKTVLITKQASNLPSDFNPDFRFIKYIGENSNYNFSNVTEYITPQKIYNTDKIKSIHSLKSEGAFYTKWQ